MKHFFKVLTLILLNLFFLDACAQKKDIRIIVRSDDIGSSHTANMACIDVYKNGIARSVEIMVPCPWFLEAVKMLKEVPGYDVGIHLTMTSEWENIKWGPITDVPSLADDDGYFYPMYWSNDRFPPERTFLGNDWKIEEVEQELKAQIDMAMKHLPDRITHMGIHMGGTSADPKIAEVHERLAKEYGLITSLEPFNVKRFDGFKGARYGEEMIINLVNALEEVGPGDYIFIDHPGYDTKEMQAIGHDGYYDVARNRDGVTKAWTDLRVKEVIQRRGIQLISYADFKKQ
jgi:predicted glycoside hydrolase/deacetylase ChbG (UPF0249 family)